MKKNKIISIGLVFLLVISIGFNIYQSQSVQEEKNDDELDWLGYYRNYMENETSFGYSMAYIGDDELRRYYTFDRIWMTEEKYVNLFWLDVLRSYNVSTIYIEEIGFNKSNITIEWKLMTRGEKPYKLNDTWFIPIPDMRISSLPSWAYGHTFSWDGEQRAWIIDCPYIHELPEPINGTIYINGTICMRGRSSLSGNSNWNTIALGGR